MIFIIIGLFIILYSLIDFKKAYYLFLVYQIFWMRLTIVINVGTMPTITLEMLMTTWFLIRFLFVKKKYIRTNIKMPLNLPILLVCLSMFVTCFTGVAGFLYEFSRMISLVIVNFSNIWITWYLVETEDDFNKVIKWYTYVFLLAALFGFVEYVLQTNFLVEYKSSLSENGINVYSLINGQKYRSRGYRLMSVFEHCIGAGMTFGLYTILSFKKYISNDNFGNKHLMLLTGILCIPCVFLTKMRSAFLFLAIGLLSCINLKKRRFLNIMFILLIGIGITFPIWQKYLYLINSFFNQDAQILTGGSSLNMRIMQLMAVISLVKSSPIGGLGEKFTHYVSNSYTLAALDYESLWLEQIAKHGVLGVMSYAFYILYSVIYMTVKYRCSTVMWLFLSLWTVYSMSSIPSFRWSFFYFVIFYFIKQTSRYRKLA